MKFLFFFSANDISYINFRLYFKNLKATREPHFYAFKI